MAKITNFFTSIFSFAFWAVLAVILVILAVIWHYESSLPDYLQLADYKPAVTTRLYAGDGSLLAEYAKEKRVFVPVEEMPDNLKHAFIAAEDKTFYSHIGIDFVGMGRAVITNLKNWGSGHRLVGASTITQQVAKNFLLTNEVSFSRKIKEALIAFKMERAFTKDHILELYLNEIYLGGSSYGVAAAALSYFDKSLDELTLAEMAFLAVLPKAPNNYDPVRNKKKAIERRDWVLDRMYKEGYITKAEMDKARAEDLVVKPRKENKTQFGDYFAETVRREIAAGYGDDSLYQGGLYIKTSLDPKLQKLATESLEKGLIAFDMKNGWRGPALHLSQKEQNNVLGTIVDEVEIADMGANGEAVKGKTSRHIVYPTKIAEKKENFRLPFVERFKRLVPPIFVPNGWKMALVRDLSDTDADILFTDGKAAKLPLKGMKWARVRNVDNTFGPEVEVPSNVLEKNDVIWVEKVKGDVKKGEEPYYALRQIPEVEGALIAMDPNTGRVLAMVGGISYKKSEFNRAVQAKRQPGSSFKPFVYLAALDSGYTPSSLILDAPFVLDQGYGLPKWKPANYVKTFYGPTTLRIGLEKSRNLMTVRLAQAVGMEKVSEYAQKFGVIDNMPPLLAMSLGSGETTLLRLTTGYAMIVNGGKRITPTFVDRIQDRTGKTIYRHDDRACDSCKGINWNEQDVPQIVDRREQVIDTRTTYQMVNILNGVMERGTGYSSRLPGKPLAGKTGTSDNEQDAWFIGFSADLVVGVFVGYDEPKSMGKFGSGATAAAPIFKDFMSKALDLIPPVPFRVPEGIKLVRVNHDTGKPAKVSDKNIIFEAFKQEDEVGQKSEVLGGASAEEDDDNLNFGTLY